jgi:DNA excision repair protein ERCC-4
LLLADCYTQGFLRAFSDNPNAFASGFNRTEKVMKALRVRRLLLFPRFHQTVKDSLEARAPEVLYLPP